MKKIAFFALVLANTAAFAAPNPADYTETLHVTASHLVFDTTTNLVTSMRLNIITGGIKYELSGIALRSTIRNGKDPGVLPVGDYKAKLIKTNYKPDYLLFESYEILLPDGKTASFQVVGETE